MAEIQSKLVSGLGLIEEEKYATSNWILADLSATAGNSTVRAAAPGAPWPAATPSGFANRRNDMRRINNLRER